MKVFAHRGFSHNFPESTKIAYEKAVEVGADGFECDVRLSRDNEIVCFHDASTKRISGKSRLVSFTDLSELRNLVNVITLDELLDIAIKAKKDLLIETKHPVIEGGRLEKKVLELLQRRGPEIERAGIEVIAMSFSLLAVLRLKRGYKNVAYVLAHRYRFLLLPTTKVAVKFDLFLNSAWVRRKLENHDVYLWTVNEIEQVANVAKCNFAGLITDRPDLRYRFEELVVRE